MYLGQHQDHASSLAKNSTPTDQPQRKPVGRWCLAGSVERLGVVGWQIEVAAVMRWRRSDGRNPPGTVELHSACSCTSWHSALCDSLRYTSSQCSSVCSSRHKPWSNLFLPLTTRAAPFKTRCKSCPSLLPERPQGQRCS